MIIAGKDLRRSVLIDPVDKCGCDELRIISGYATPSMASNHMDMLKENGLGKIKIKLIVGMTPIEGIYEGYHRGFRKLMDEDYSSEFECSYLLSGQTPCHSKLYVWLKNGEPIAGFQGSANYTNRAFFGNQEEILVELDPVHALNYFNSFTGRSICCNHSEVDQAVWVMSQKQYDKTRNNIVYGGVMTPSYYNEKPETFTLTLLARDGKTGERSGLNWGQRGGRNPNQAYIPVPRRVAKSGFFPEAKQQFTVLTDDGKSLICVIAQEGDKAIETPNNNSDLGLYLRKRIGVEPGAYVYKEDLDRYGRTNVEFIKIDEETYYMDFSVTKRRIYSG